MSSALVNRTKRDENRAMRDYLDHCRDWIYDLYTNHGVRFNELHRVLVHRREPWVDTSKLRSAIARWKAKDEPGPWPLQQIPENPAFVIPLPPTAPPHLLSRLGVTEPVLNGGHLSLPMTPLPSHSNQEMLRYTDPSSSMPTSMVSPGMPMSSNPVPYHTAQWQQPNQAFATNSAFQPGSQAALPISHQSPSSLSETAETAENGSMDNAGEPDGSRCQACGGQLGLSCQCYPYEV